MKRFKDCILLCNSGQTPSELLKIVHNKCEELGFFVEASTVVANANIICVDVKFKEFPNARIVLDASEKKGGVEIINIVPLHGSGVSILEIPIYNAILDKFRLTIFDAIVKEKGNKIEELSEDYTIQEIIPKSFEKLNLWLNAFPLSHHPNDEHRWYDFLISIIKNEEDISSDVLCEYIREQKQWSEKDLSNLELRFEDQLELLKYYQSKEQLCG